MRHDINPYDLSSVAEVTKPYRSFIKHIPRSTDVFSCGGKNSGSWDVKRSNGK